MPTAPTPIDLLPDPPDSSDTATFDARADAALAAQQDMVPQMNAAIQVTFNNAVEAANAATSADADASSAANSALVAGNAAGAPLWVSGTGYDAGDVVRSPSNGRIYMRKISGAGTTDPSADATNWLLVAPNGLQMVTHAGTTGSISQNEHAYFSNTSRWDATAPASPATGCRLELIWKNGRYDNTLDLGSNGVQGFNGVIVSGVLTLNRRNPLRLQWWGDYWRMY